MLLTKRGRKRLLTLMVIHELSQRQLSTVAGYKSHSYLGRLLRGEVSSLEPEAALRIANRFQVPVEDLFLIRVSSKTGHGDQEVVA